MKGEAAKIATSPVKTKAASSFRLLAAALRVGWLAQLVEAGPLVDRLYGGRNAAIHGWG